uniref:Uncharacterized protein n=1 Tax=Anguilla anguilla TaxID=7936 RepID=A0A0E9P861_ANGAN
MGKDFQGLREKRPPHSFWPKCFYRYVPLTFHKLLRCRWHKVLTAPRHPCPIWPCFIYTVFL